jgi:hypothetical protein
MVRFLSWINGEIAVLSFNRMVLDYPTSKLTSETQEARKAEF